jgi:hypothetical protein
VVVRAAATAASTINAAASATGGAAGPPSGGGRPAGDQHLHHPDPEDAARLAQHRDRPDARPRCSAGTAESAVVVIGPSSRPIPTPGGHECGADDPQLVDRHPGRHHGQPGGEQCGPAHARHARPEALGVVPAHRVATSSGRIAAPASAGPRSRVSCRVAAP